MQTVEGVEAGGQQAIKNQTLSEVAGLGGAEAGLEVEAEAEILDS